MPVIKIDKNDFDTQVLSGYLVKSPPLTKRGMRRWQKRYFVLRANRFLEYYKNSHSSIPKGVIDLRECVRMEVGLQFRKMRHILNVQTYQRLYYFNAPSEIEMRQWADLVYKVKEAMEGDVIDVSLNPSLMAPEIVTGTAANDSITRTTGSHDQIDHTLRTEMTRSRQYSRIVLKRKEKPLDRRFLKKSIRYTGYYQQEAADKDSSESEPEDSKITGVPEDAEIIDAPPVIKSPVGKVNDNVMGLIQSVESLSNFFDVPSNVSHELQSDLSQQGTTSESSGYESMESPTEPSTANTIESHAVSSTVESMDIPTQPSTLESATTNTTTTITPVMTPFKVSRIKARKSTKPIPRPRQHRPAGVVTKQNSQTGVQQLLGGQTLKTTFNPQSLITCAAGIGCFGNDGGVLTADNSKVMVTIPEGSVPLTAKPYIVQYEVCGDYRPSVLPAHPVGPLVHVKCSNTTFTSPVTMTIPHHVDNVDHSSCVVLATKQDLTTQSTVDFTVFPVTNSTGTVTEVTSNMTCALKEDHVSISMKSLQDYQWFMLTVNSEAIMRNCRMLVFHSRPKHGNFIIKISIVEDFPDAIQAAIQVETCNSKFSLDSDNITYQLKDWEGSSYVSLDELEFGFSLLEGVSTKTVTLHGNRCWGTAEFVVKEMFNTPKMFTCDVVIDTNHLSHFTNTIEIQPYIM